MRDSTLVISAFIALVLLGVFWYGASSIRSANGAGVAFTELASGQQSSVTTRENYLITSDTQLEKLWGLVETSEPLPSIDFTKESVIVAFAGEEPTAGYSIGVMKITDTGERMVTIQLTAPGPSCSVAEVVTAPYQILSIPKTDLTLAHEDVMTTTSCI